MDEGKRKPVTLGSASRGGRFYARVCARGQEQTPKKLLVKLSRSTWIFTHSL